MKDAWLRASSFSSTSAHGLEQVGLHSPHGSAAAICPRLAELRPQRGNGLQVVAILCGSQDSLQQASSSWLELLVAQMQHVYPDLVVQAQIGTLLERCLDGKGSTDQAVILMMQNLLEVRHAGLFLPI